MMIDQGKMLVLAATLGGALVAPRPLCADDAAGSSSQVLAIFQTHCVACHSGKDAKNGLDLAALPGVTKGGKNGPVVRPGSLRESRLWQKIHMDLMPAEGPALSAKEKQIIRDWIVDGAWDPAAAAKWNPSVALEVPKSASDPLAVAKEIDRLIDARLAAENVSPSPPADPLVWLRRVHLDITGRLPTNANVLAWAKTGEFPAQTKIIDDLLASSHYGNHFATVWHNRIVPLSGNKRLYDSLLRQYFAKEFNQGTGWHAMVKQLLTIEQESGKDKRPIGFFQPRPQPKLMAADATQLFLGVQLQCAECHNHPGADWSQGEYWGMAAFFSAVRAGKGMVTEKPPVANGKTPPKNAPPPAKPGEIEIPTDVLAAAGATMPAKFLGETKPADSSTGQWRDDFAAWLTSPKNPWFARAYVNVVWQHFFGKGLVSPVDDLDLANPPSHPEILDRLAAEFVASNFDHKHLVRCIANTAAYRRSSEAAADNRKNDSLLAAARVRLLSPEQCFTALVDLGFSKNLGKEEDFITFFMHPSGMHDAGNYHHGLLQVMRLANNPDLNSGGRHAADAIKLEKSEGRPKGIERMYLAYLCRRPTAEELKVVDSFLERSENLETGYAGVSWMLLNSAEFVLNH